jgi:hypothetical protein
MRTSPPRFWLTIVSKKRFGIPQILGRGFESQTDLSNTLVACKTSGARIAFAGSPRKTEATILTFPIPSSNRITYGEWGVRVT